MPKWRHRRLSGKKRALLFVLFLLAALLALAILFSNSYGGCITHYGGAAGPIIFAAGYNDIKSWWLTGTIIALLTFLLHMVVGIPWWGFLIQHGIL